MRNQDMMSGAGGITTPAASEQPERLPWVVEFLLFAVLSAGCGVPIGGLAWVLLY